MKKYINMAASTDLQMSCRLEHIEELLNLLSTQFLEMVPVRRMKWSDDETAALVATPRLQQRILQATVLNPICRLHPPALSYRTHFMKQFIQKLEQMDADICDEVYEAYTELLSQREVDDDTLCFKSYSLPSGEKISLQESVSLVSQGTTGLSTWQAGEHLAEWIIENPSVLQDKKVLELGSGLGMTGLLACRVCHLKSYTFTDCHSQVLFLLAKNIEGNLCRSSSPAESIDTHGHSTDSRDRKMFRKIKRQLSLTTDKTDLPAAGDRELAVVFSEVTDYEAKVAAVAHCSSSSGSGRPARSSKADDEDEISVTDDDNDQDITELSSPGSELKLEVSDVFWKVEPSYEVATLRSDPRVRLCHLQWDEPSPLVLKDLQADIILAADVVYDPGSIPSLVRILHTLMNSSCCTAYISSTVRNEDTRDAFLIALGSEGLCYSVVEGPKNQLFHYDRMVPIEIIQVSKAA